MEPWQHRACHFSGQDTSTKGKDKTPERWKAMQLDYNLYKFGLTVLMSHCAPRKTVSSLLLIFEVS